MRVELESDIQHDWTHKQIRSIYEKPFNDVLFWAHQVHRRHFDPNTVQLSTLLSIKTGACPNRNFRDWPRSCSRSRGWAWKRA